MTARRIDLPQPGFFKTRAIRSGPWIPCELRYNQPLDPETGDPLDRSFMWEAFRDGVSIGSPSPDPTRAGVMAVWPYWHAITEDEFRYLTELRKWQRENAPEELEKPTRYRRAPKWMEQYA